MKQQFWIHQYEILFFWPLMGILSFACLIIGIVMTTKASLYWPILAFGTFFSIFCICTIFFQKKLLCKITFSNEEITIKRLGKNITIMKWSEVTRVEGHLYGSNGGRYMSFISQNEKIDVIPTQKMYNAIILLCPYSNIKNQINNIECFKWFHRNK
jgi:energy-converting hydrogenase Eha subunit C